MFIAKTSEEAIEKIHEITAIKGEPGLERMGRVLELLGNPEKDFKIIHVAGTNGKGSTCEFISEILKMSGYSVSVYTSPHLLIYNERFESNNRFITDEEFTLYSNEIFKILSVIEKEGFGLPSQFEILTAIAYLFFKDQRTDFVVLEVGLGGRIDSTNTIEPLVSVITEIGIDHVTELGNDISKIAYEKAGVIKEGVPVICGVTTKVAKKVIAEEAVEMGAPFVDVSESKCFIPELNMKGEHQIRNAKLAKEVIYTLKDLGAVKTSNEIIDEGLSKARKLGRFEVLQDMPALIIDAAHNSSGIKSALETFDGEHGRAVRTDGEIVLILGFMADKTFNEMIDEIAGFLQDYESIKIIATEPESDRALKAEVLKEKLLRKGFETIAIGDNEDAYDYAMNLRCEYTLCMGSIYLIGNIKYYYSRKGWWKKC